MSKHTPGPWRLDSLLSVLTHEEGNFIAMCGESETLSDDEMCANARLIAVAPEMLEALKSAREDIADWASYAGEYFQGKHDLAGDLAKLDALIAKAEGSKS